MSKLTVEDILRERFKTASFKYRKAILIVFKGNRINNYYGTICTPNFGRPKGPGFLRTQMIYHGTAL